MQKRSNIRLVQGKKDIEHSRENMWKKKELIFSKADKRYQFTNLKNSTNTKQEN